LAPTTTPTAAPTTKGYSGWNCEDYLEDGIKNQYITDTNLSSSGSLYNYLVNAGYSPTHFDILDPNTANQFNDSDFTSQNFDDTFKSWLAGGSTREQCKNAWNVAKEAATSTTGGTTTGGSATGGSATGGTTTGATTTGGGMMGTTAGTTAGTTINRQAGGVDLNVKNREAANRWWKSKLKEKYPNEYIVLEDDEIESIYRSFPRTLDGNIDAALEAIIRANTTAERSPGGTTTGGSATGGTTTGGTTTGGTLFGSATGGTTTGATTTGGTLFGSATGGTLLGSATGGTLFGSATGGSATGGTTTGGSATGGTTTGGSATGGSATGGSANSSTVSTTTGKKKSLFSDGIGAEEVVIIGLVVTSASILILLSAKLYTTRM
jgi:hypothetical protein